MEHHDGMNHHVQMLVEELLEEICEKATPAFCDVLKSIPIRVLWESPEHDRYGDFFGVPLDEGDGLDSAPADIILYASPLLRDSHHEQNELRQMVKVTLMHEIGHYLGLNHAELKERGWD